MAKGIGHLAVVLGMNSKQFNAGIREAENRVKGLGANTKRAEATIKASSAAQAGAFAQMGKGINTATAGVRGLTSALSSSLGIVPQLVTAAAVVTGLGLGVKKLADYFTGMGEAAKLAGLNVSDPLVKELQKIKGLAEGLPTVNMLGLDADQKRLKELRGDPATGEMGEIGRARANLDGVLTLGTPREVEFDEAQRRKQLQKLEAEERQILDRIRRARSLTSQKSAAEEMAANNKAAEEYARNWLSGIETVAQQKNRIDDVVANRAKEIRDEARRMQEELEWSSLDAAGRLNAEYEKRLELVKELRSMGGAEDMERAAELEKMARDALNRGMEALTPAEVEAELSNPAGAKQGIEALVRGSAAAEAFGFDSAQRKTVDLAAKSLEMAKRQDRKLAAIERNTADKVEVVVTW